MWKGIWALISCLPVILDALKKLVAAAEAGEREIYIHVQLGKFDNAAQIAQSEKDTSELEALFKGPK